MAIFSASYECSSCGKTTRQQFAGSLPDAAECPRCHAEARPLVGNRWMKEAGYAPGVQLAVKGFKKYKPTALDVPVGWERGLTNPAKNHERFKEHWREQKKLANAAKSGAIKRGFRHIADVPYEIDRIRRRQFGNDYWRNNVEQHLKDEGLHFDCEG